MLRSTLKMAVDVKASKFVLWVRSPEPIKLKSFRNLPKMLKAS